MIAVFYGLEWPLLEWLLLRWGLWFSGGGSIVAKSRINVASALNASHRTASTADKPYAHPPGSQAYAHTQLSEDADRRCKQLARTDKGG